MEIRQLTPLLQVFDMPQALAFYRDRLGFSLAAASAPGDDCDWALLRLSDFALMLNTAFEREERPAAMDLIRVAAHADTTLYFECGDADAVYIELLAKGVPAAAPISTHYGMRQVYVHDPDGYQLCFQHSELPAEQGNR